jgi:hypothetical protein
MGQKQSSQRSLKAKAFREETEETESSEVVIDDTQEEIEDTQVETKVSPQPMPISTPHTNVDFSFGEHKQPKEIQICVFTTSNSEEIYFDEVFCMTISLQLSVLSGVSNGVHMRVCEFLGALFERGFSNLKTLNLLGFHADRFLWGSVYKLEFEMLNLHCSLLGEVEISPRLLPGFKELSLTLGEKCDLVNFPSSLLYSLKALSLYFYSNVINNDEIVDIRSCKGLRKM